ncbi:MAG: hypothetical protein JKY86_01205 [Gammaproteobacteria bacterium]|nr:hypothetical protein [Gammaproteobacteria bacterium]
MLSSKRPSKQPKKATVKAAEQFSGEHVTATRLSVDISTELHRKLKLLAAAQGVSQRTLVIEALQSQYAELADAS